MIRLPLSSKNNMEPTEPSLVLSGYTILLAYAAIINIYAFFIFGFDKARSTQNGAKRIRERTLWLSMLFGGSLGALLAMYLFRHKTKKLSFQSVAALILMVQILGLVFIYNYFFSNLYWQNPKNQYTVEHKQFRLSLPRERLQWSRRKSRSV